MEPLESPADDLMFTQFERQKKETMAGLNAALMQAEEQAKEGK
jgi:hypothetical protein